MGKTALASGIAGYASKQFLAEAARDSAKVKAVLEFELEMSTEQMARRRLSAVTSIPLHKLKYGNLDTLDWERLLAARERLGKLPIFTDDSPNLSIADIRSRCRRFLRKGPIGLIMVDHIGLVRAADPRSNNRVADITAITSGLKNLAKEFGVPVLALSQLSRQVEQRDDKRPMLADLRDSGSIEQDADVVLFVYREEYYLKRSEPAQAPNEDSVKFQERLAKWQARLNDEAGRAEIIVAKQRDGDTGSAKCAFDGALTLFRNLTDKIDQGDFVL
jgi:replicative DNA helicase